MRPLFLTFLMLGACGEPAPECVDHGNCDEGEVCVNSECRVAECLTSDECGYQHFCDQTRFVCREGCRADTDCLAGQTCDKPNKTCMDAACTSTELDCPVGTFCDAVTGACYEGDLAECDTCNANNPLDCGNGSYCLAVGDPQPGYCFHFCDTQDECPSGFTCTDVGGTSKVCVSDCAWLIDHGYY